MAVVVDPALTYDREIAKGVAQYAREAGDWRLYVEEEQSRRLPDFAAWSGQGIIASFDEPLVAQAVVAAGLRVPFDVAVIGVDDDEFVCELSDPPLSSVAPRAGFRSIASMTTVFRRHFRTTPAALRTAARGGH